jgi:hypothetical protein
MYTYNLWCYSLTFVIVEEQTYKCGLECPKLHHHDFMNFFCALMNLQWNRGGANKTYATVTNISWFLTFL